MLAAAQNSSLSTVLKVYAHTIGTARLSLDLFLIAASAGADGLGIAALAMLASSRHLAPIHLTSTNAFLHFARDLSFGTWLGVFLLVFFLRNILVFLRDQSLEISRQRFLLDLQQNSFFVLTRARWITLVRENSAEIQHAHLLAVENLSRGIDAFSQIPGILCFTLFTLVVVAIASPLLLSVLAVWTLLTIVVLRRQLTYEREASFLRAHFSRQLTASLDILLGALKLFKSHGAEDEHRRVYFKTLQQRADLIVLHRGRIRGSNLVMQGLVTFSLSILFFTSYSLHLLTTSQMFLIALLISRLVPQLRTVQNSWARVAGMPVSFDEIAQLNARLVASAESSLSADQNIPLHHSFQMHNISFRYEASSAQPVLRNISLTLPAGTLTVITGASGSGKTTLLDLMLGLNTSDTGRITIDNVDLSDSVLPQWQRSIGYVPQDAVLLNDTLRTNLLWLQPDATEDDLYAALHQSCAFSFVQDHPQGLDTIVGERGARLSGGERQRIAIARALLRHPSLLILDEATSALDEPTERAVLHALRYLTTSMTIVAVTHRRSLLPLADQVFHLEAGTLRTQKLVGAQYQIV